MHESSRISSLHMPAEVFLCRARGNGVKVRYILTRNAATCHGDLSAMRRAEYGETNHVGIGIFVAPGPTCQNAACIFGCVRATPVCVACVCVGGRAYVFACSQSVLHALCTPTCLRDNSRGYLVYGTTFGLLPDIYLEKILGGVCEYLDLNLSHILPELSWQERDRSDMKNSIQTRP
jgi:hypothetical protein